jgi:hypothetical protein
VEEDGRLPMASDLDSFINDETDIVITDLDDLVGPVEIREWTHGATCYTRWGGWHWQADGGDRLTAWRRLTDRLSRLNPFDGFDTDWGEPGWRVEELDDRIPEAMRDLMLEWDQYHEQRESDLVGVANDIVRRSRAAEAT